MDVRDPTGKIVARLDKSGCLIGSRLAIQRPDKSTLVVIDEYGVEALNIHYLNPSALSVNGYLNFNGKIENIQRPHVSQTCSYVRQPGSVDILIQ